MATVDANFWGEGGFDIAGSSVSIIGDIDNDGLADLLIGAPNADHMKLNNGKAYLIMSSSQGIASANLSSSDVIFFGELDEDRAGTKVAGVGDVNADGYDDFMIGAPQNDRGGPGAGAAYLFFGKTSGWNGYKNLSDADLIIYGEAIQDELGASFDKAGDVNGDGIGDIVLASSKNDENDPESGKVYIIFGKKTGWPSEMNVSNADFSITGESKSHNAGNVVSWAGDINGDDLDDILIGADKADSNNGRVYVLFGRYGGWPIGQNLSQADASIYGENTDFIGLGLAGPGDINGDGYADIVIGAPYDTSHGGGSMRGMILIYFGKASGWSHGITYATCDGLYYSNRDFDTAGQFVSRAGDVNGDGYNDFLVGAENANTAVKSRSFLFLGKTGGWSTNSEITTGCDLYFDDETANVRAVVVSGGGDANGDGYDDILIGGRWSSFGGKDAGKAYLIYPDDNSKPSQIDSVLAYPDNTYADDIRAAEVNDTIYIELVGTDTRPGREDMALVSVESSHGFEHRFTLRLIETGLATGRYRGNFEIRNRTHPDYRWIKGTTADHITVTSLDNENKKTVIWLDGSVDIQPSEDNLTAIEDQPYVYGYIMDPSEPTTWEFNTNASWLSADIQTDHIDLSGTPTNADVGTYWVYIKGTQAPKWDDRNFTITVLNTPPEILTEDITKVMEDSQYHVDYDSSDDGQGTIIWKEGNEFPEWLDLDFATGNITGTPIDEDNGFHTVNFSVEDDHGGETFREFILEVVNSNDPPVVLFPYPAFSMDEDTVDEHIDLEKFFTDIDGDNLTYSISGNNKISYVIQPDGKVTLKPEHNWAGTETLTFTANDSLAEVSYNVIVTVIEVNDPPENVQITLPNPDYFEGQHQPVTGSAEDPDLAYGDSLTYEWFVNQSSTGATGLSANLALTAGVYNLSLIATDLQGEIAVGYAELIVRSEDENTTTDDDDDVDDDITPDDDVADDDVTPPDDDVTDDDITPDDDVVDPTDTDGDGLPDEWERKNFGDLESSNGDEDSDGDGWSNIEEYQAGTDPNDPTSKPGSADDDDEPKSSNVWVFIVVAILVLVVVIVIIILLVLKRSKKDDEKTAPEQPAKPKSQPQAQQQPAYPDEPVDTAILEMAGQMATPDALDAEVATADIFDAKKFGKYAATGSLDGPDGPKTRVDGWDIGEDGLPETAEPEEIQAEEDLLDNPYEELINDPLEGRLALPPAQIFEADFTNMPQVDEIFVMTTNGLLIEHFSYKRTSMVDEDILASMLTVIQNFVKDSFKGGKAAIKEMRLGNFNILIVKGEFLDVVAISPQEKLLVLEKPLKSMLDELETMNRTTLENWDGNKDSIEGVYEFVNKLVHEGY